VGDSSIAMDFSAKNWRECAVATAASRKARDGFALPDQRVA
jgi:hypothetical protein